MMRSCQVLDQQCSYPKLSLLHLMSKSLTAAGAILGNIHTNGRLPYVPTIWKHSFFPFPPSLLRDKWHFSCLFQQPPRVKVFRHVASCLYWSKKKKIKVVLWHAVRKPSRCWRFLDLVFPASSGREWRAVISFLNWMNAGPSFTNTTKKIPFFPIFSKSFRLSEHDYFIK